MIAGLVLDREMPDAGAQPGRRLGWSLAVAIVVVPPCAPRDAWAADPTTSACLAASERSLEAAANHRLRAERTELLTCAAATCPKIVRTECTDRIAEVNAQMPTLVVEAKDTTGADLSAVRVRMDGEVLVERLDGTAFAVDPGEHTFSFEAPDQDRVVRTLLILEAQKDRREVVVIGAPSGLSTQRIAALVVGGVGVAGIGVGAIFGGVALSQKSAAEAVCPENTCRTQDGVNKWSSATSSGNISTVGLVVGGIAAAVGGALWLTAPSANSASKAQVGFAPGTIYLKGNW